VGKKSKINFYEKNIVKSLYRPYTRNYLYYDRVLNERVLKNPLIFPAGDTENLVISMAGVGAKEFSVLISNVVTGFDSIEKGQCFPLYTYKNLSADSGETSQSALFNDDEAKVLYGRNEAITDEGFQHFQDAYPGGKISKEDIFYYVYGLLHSQEYRDRYADNLSKELPRIPRVKTAEGFWGFSKAGRELANWHLNYETIEPYKATVEEKGDKSDKVAFYRVEKMKHPKVKNEEGKSVNDLTKVIYNSRITVSDIPVEAYDYVVNGKPAIEWVIERQCVKTDKASGIVNDANDWANETMNDPRYPLDLLLRVIRVSLETNRIVASLPALDID
jgi:predicted helicase